MKNLGDRNNFGNFNFFFEKKCKIHLVELDVFPKIWVLDPKTACISHRSNHISFMI